MRWGVRDEATDDHMTTELCMNEIRNCQRLSTGPNFVVFLGQKYGYRPIPTIIDGKFSYVRKQFPCFSVKNTALESAFSNTISIFWLPNLLVLIEGRLWSKATFLLCPSLSLYWKSKFVNFLLLGFFCLQQNLLPHAASISNLDALKSWTSNIMCFYLFYAISRITWLSIQVRSLRCWRNVQSSLNLTMSY